MHVDVFEIFTWKYSWYFQYLQNSSAKYIVHKCIIIIHNWNEWKKR